MRGPSFTGDRQALLLNIWGDFTNAKTIHDIFDISVLPIGTTGPTPKMKSMRRTKTEMRKLKEKEENRMKSKEVKSEDLMVFRTKTEPDFMPIPQALLDEIAEMEALESERR